MGKELSQIQGRAVGSALNAKKGRNRPLKVAVDVQVPFKADIPFFYAGFYIVVRAKAKEKDADWVWRAIKADVDFVLSNDDEVIYVAECCGIKTVRIPEGIKGMNLVWRLVELLRGARNSKSNS